MSQTKKYIFFLLFLVPNLLFSQIFPKVENDNFSKFIHYTTDNGLSDNRVLDIIQDEKGFIWLATENGLNKFDGYSFKNYFPGNFVSIPDETVLDLETDQFGTLWVATSNGLCYYNREKDQFYTIDKNDTDSLGFPDRSIRKLLADNQGNLWIETKLGYLVKMNILSGKIQYWKHKQVDQEYYRYHALFQDKNKNIWCGGRACGPYFFNRNEEKFYLLPIDQNNPAKKREIDTGEIFEDSRQNLWITGLDGIYLYNRTTGIFTKQFGTSTYQIIEDRKGRLWFATGNGLLRFDFEKNIFLHFTAHPDVQSGLNNNVVYCVYEDKAGNVWAGTSEGVNLYVARNEMLTHLTHNTGAENTLSSNDISCAFQDFDSEIWLGTREHGINRFFPGSFEIKTIRADGKKTNSLASDRISTIYQTKDSSIWIGLWSGHGFYRFNKKTESFKRIAQIYNTRTHDWYNDFLQRDDKNLWVASWGGFGLLNCELTNLTTLPDKMEDVSLALPSRLITCLLAAENGNLYIGTYDKGFCWYNPDSETSEIYRDGFPDSTKLWGNLINDMKYGTENEIWIAAKGLNRFDKQTKKFEHFLSDADFANLEINSILSYQQNLWLGTNQGIIVFNTSTHKILHLNKSNILPFNQFSKAAIKLSDGNFLFGGKSGAIIFNPDSLLLSQNNFPLPAITQINNFKEVLYADATQQTDFKFNYKQHDLTFHFSTLNLFGNNSLQYEYKLNEYQDEWVSTQVNQNIVNISNIKNGTYEFQVRLKGDLGTGSIYMLQIKPAFWQTTWFLLLLILFVVSLFVLYLWIQRSRLIAEKNAIIAEQKLLRTQMNPHFIFNSLMAIQHYLLKQDSNSAAKYLGKFSKLMRAILSNSAEELITLEKEIEFLDNYLMLQKLRFEDSFEYSIVVDEDIAVEMVKIPPMLMQPFIENAIEHGLKSNGGGKVKIRISLDGDDLKMEVEDNGIGYRAGMENSKEFGDHKSMATKITTERLNLLHKKRKDKITFEIEDLSERGGKGTLVSFKIPVS